MSGKAEDEDEEEDAEEEDEDDDNEETPGGARFASLIEMETRGGRGPTRKGGKGGQTRRGCGKSRGGRGSKRTRVTYDASGVEAAAIVPSPRVDSASLKAAAMVKAAKEQIDALSGDKWSEKVNEATVNVVKTDLTKHLQYFEQRGNGSVVSDIQHALSVYDDLSTLTYYFRLHRGNLPDDVLIKMCPTAHCCLKTARLSIACCFGNPFQGIHTQCVSYAAYAGCERSTHMLHAALWPVPF